MRTRCTTGRRARQADSNGSGKTTLCMAALWALTGRCLSAQIGRLSVAALAQIVFLARWSLWALTGKCLGGRAEQAARRRGLPGRSGRDGVR